MAQLSNREKTELKTLLTERMDEIEAKLDTSIEKIEEQIDTLNTEIKSEINSVRQRVINILGLDEEEQPTSQKRRTTSNPVSRSSRRERIPS